MSIRLRLVSFPSTCLTPFSASCSPGMGCGYGEEGARQGEEVAPPSRGLAHHPLLLSCLSQWLQVGQGRPTEEVPEILAQLPEQVVVLSSPADLLAVLGTMRSLAKVVAEARIHLNRSALEVRSLSHSRSQLGCWCWKLFPSRHFCPSDITMGCQMADVSGVPVSAPWVHLSSWVPVSKAME